MHVPLTGAAFDAHPLPRERWPAPKYRMTEAERAASPNLPLAEQRRLAVHDRPEVRFALAANPSIAPDVQLLLAKDRFTAIALAGNPSLCDRAQVALLRLASPLITSTLVSESLLSAQLLAALLAGSTYRGSLARNRRLPAEAYRTLLRHQDLAVRTTLGSNPGVESDELALLAGDPREPVRVAVARNPSLPQELQRRLAQDSATAVRRALAGSPALQPDVQVVLARDPSACVDLASNREIGPAAIDRLLASPAAIGFGLAGHPGLNLRQQLELTRIGGPTVRARLAVNPCLHPVLQLRFCDDLDEDVRSQLARSPALVSDAQERLAVQRSSSIRASLLGNRSLERAALRAMLDALLAGDRDWLGHASFESSGLGPGSRWTRSHLDHPVHGPMIALLSGRATLLDAAARHRDPLVRWALLCNGRIGARRLSALLDDSEEVIRQAAQTLIVAALAA